MLRMVTTLKVLPKPENISLHELDLPLGTLNILRDAGVKNVKELCEMEDDDFWNIRNMNKEQHRIIEVAVENKLTTLMNEAPRKKPTALHVAQYFISQSKISSPYAVTNLKLQKLLYYAQGFHLAVYGEPLFEEEIQAWAHGPVIPSVYNRLKRYGYFSLDPTRNYLIDEDTGELYDDPYLKEYYKGFELEKKPEVDLTCPFVKRLFHFKKKD